MMKNREHGFTLIEIAIVLIIITILFGYTMAMLPVQQELKQYRQANTEMDKIIDSLYAFAQVNGYLPCPANNNVGSSGLECRDTDGLDGDCESNDPTAGSCDIWFGFVPGKTLGLEGKYSALGLLLDPWGEPYIYQLTDADNEDNNDDGDGADIGDGDGIEDFSLPGGIQNTSRSTVGLAINLGVLSPDLVICNTDRTPGAAGNADVNCTNASETIFGAAATTLPCTDPNQQCAPVVILSTGKDKAGDVAATSWTQRENLDNDPADRVFVKRTFNNATGAEYDDLVKWISPNILYSKMIEAGQLP